MPRAQTVLSCPLSWFAEVMRMAVLVCGRDARTSVNDARRWAEAMFDDVVKWTSKLQPRGLNTAAARAC